MSMHVDTGSVALLVVYDTDEVPDWNMYVHVNESTLSHGTANLSQNSFSSQCPKIWTVRQRSKLLVEILDSESPCW